ncbi:MAG: cyclase family protein [Saprospirales bacterium]|nr:MAG: cyclase family protein [Saprospirales bacterium]
MEGKLQLDGRDFKFDLNEPLSIGIPLKNGKNNPNCFYASPPKFMPYESGDFVGSIKSGSPVNFFNVFFNPHGNGTHTECSGHVFDNGLVMAGLLKRRFFSAYLVSVEVNDGQPINAGILAGVPQGIESLVVRTVPNGIDKIARVYSGKSPVYCEPELMAAVAGRGIQHFLIDLPSVDPESDGGKLLAHKAFWNYDGIDRTRSTITELIYVPEEVFDGAYALEMQFMNIELDAAPSDPILYRLEEK